ncbi:hypothetical protein ACFQHO_08990 [Actinomadura yumaensis]|uniref:hypothetical protein n=1 Tax=Actinomadura yumaensis TaxID=111807 RepID=UPI0036078189
MRGGADQVERARTALAGVVPGKVATTPADPDAVQAELLADLRTGALTVLAVSFLIAITSAGITGASAVLDRRQAYAMLRLAGTPLQVLDRARRQETVIPLAVMGGGSILTGLFFAAPFAAGFGVSGALTLLAFVVLGFAGILGAGALSRPSSAPSPPTRLPVRTDREKSVAPQEERRAGWAHGDQGGRRGGLARDLAVPARDRGGRRDVQLAARHRRGDGADVLDGGAAGTHGRRRGR